ncbi:nicotinate phosphoribosyltransferase [Methanoplanus sp. FWC-SCC4]|uniref:nicotinate phosphoribosyltransferase n=1 Tax=Methanochimaera problematica TaxID=2609417 RepID=A0AA97FFG0_9EURY|nr:nicotinate phosphoribosyltransferase [Methanoplanus sp. FWC-SCC4]WOF16461.1 nicotinate phosphoribosyltransferase [Methanoplanus sp. FWC-SCC4]
MGIFQTIDDEIIRAGDCTDIYFIRTEEILAAEDKNPKVTAEITVSSLPDGWGILCGLSDALWLLEGLPIDVYAMPEGSMFYPGEPVIRIVGNYRDFCRFETSLLGFLCHASGIASAAALIKGCAGERAVYSFGSRRQHPSIAEMIERSAWIGGVDGVSNTCAPSGLPLIGTMPHSFVMCYDNPKDSWVSFAKHAPEDVPRVMLCDTFCDEKREALSAAKRGAVAIRLDTPSSRKGDMRSILEEVRWELDVNGFENVRLFLSGGLGAGDILEFRDIVDAFGVGGAIANAPVVDFSLDIVEIEGKPVSKRGKKSGVKEVYEFENGNHILLPAGAPAPENTKPMLKIFMKDGQILSMPDMNKSRMRVLMAIQNMTE